MKISQKHFFLGTLFSHGGQASSITVKTIDDHSAHFRIEDSLVLAKAASQSAPPWSFTFRPDEIQKLQVDRLESYSADGDAYVALICGHQKVCLLGHREWGKVLGGTPPLKRQQSVQVDQKPGCQLEVSGTHGQLQRKIPASRFPKVFY